VLAVEEAFELLAVLVGLGIGHEWMRLCRRSPNGSSAEEVVDAVSMLVSWPVNA
jgi:hypothetical protein